MFRQKFPKSTPQSKNQATLIRKSIRNQPTEGAEGRPKNLMISVVTTEGGGVAVAASGDETSTPSRRRANFFARLVDGRNRFSENHQPAHWNQVSRSNAAIAESLVVPTKRDPRGRPMQLIPGHRTLDVNSEFGRRTCAEPKALELAASFGQRITGMTTFWHGPRPNPSPANPNPANPSPANATPRPADPLDIAKPCDWCQLNESRIMNPLAKQGSRRTMTL